MNPIWMRLMGRWKCFRTPPACPLCQDKGYLLKPWKRNSDWTLERIDCPRCQRAQRKDLTHV
jgi:hypothetical protein